MASVHEQLSEQFYKWESRGRGWQVFKEPVYPEPPFRPFPGHFLPDQPVVDDGRSPTVLSSWFQRLTRKSSGQPPPVPVVPESDEEPEPDVLIRDALVELQTYLPAKLDIGTEAFEHFLRSLALCREPVAFELLGTAGRVCVQFVAGHSDAPLVRRQLQAYFPEAMFLPRRGALETAWDSCLGAEMLVVEFGLEREFMFPLASGKLDPFIGTVGALAELEPTDLGLFQVLFQPVHGRWAEGIVNSVSHADGKPFFVNMPELTKAAENKVTRPLYAAVVRVATKGKTFERALETARDLTGSLRVFAHPQGNALIPLENPEDYAFEDHIDDALRRQSRRSGMVLNSDELIGFVHLPSSAVRSPVLLRDAGMTKAAPAIVRGDKGVLLGNNLHADESIPVRLTPDQRVQHTHIIGVHGTGKSTLLYNLIRQDIENGDGLAVLDPHGDLINQILGSIPPGRVDDVVLVDPSDEEYSVGFNILSAHSDLEKRLLASDLVSVFQRHSTSWGDQMGSVLKNAILAFLESSEGGTLSDLRRFLLEPAFRERFLKTVGDPDIVYYWCKGFTQLSGNKSIGPVITRLNDFLAPKPIRYMVSQPANRLDFGQILDSGKIFLARLPQGEMGWENAFLLGSLLVAKFQQLAMGRQAQQIADRRNFWLYIDEFQNFITPSMAEILAGARKYRLGLILAHQELRHLERDRDVASAVLSNPFTRVVFRVGDADARALEHGFSFFEARHFQNLGIGQAICRVEKADNDFNLSTPLPEAIDPDAAKATRQAVIAASRAKYAIPRAEVQAAAWAKLEADDTGQEPAKAKPASPPLLQRSEKKAAEGPKSTPSGRKEPGLVPAAEAPLSASPDISQRPEPQASATPATAATPIIEPAAESAGSDTESPHEAIKLQIASEAESLDYTVALEKPGLPGEGRPDIVLSRGSRRIACEVTVTTHVEDEVEHIHKRLQAGFQHIAVISVNRKKLNRIQLDLTQGGLIEQPLGVGFYSPAEFISQLFDWATADPEGGRAERAKPRKRTMALDAGKLTEAERKLRQEEMLNNLRKVLKR